jgi:Zn-dependent protease with chaperone function
MIIVRGVYYDGITSQEMPADLEVYDNGEVRWAGATVASSVTVAQLRIAPRVGNIPRSVYFPDGAKFETEDNDTVDALARRWHLQRGGRFLHLLETHKRYIATALVVVVISSWAFVQYGVPALAKWAAFALPAEANSKIGAGALDILDKGIFAPTQLNAATQKRITRRFKVMTADAPAGLTLKLEFRRGKAVGANAFALPSGTIVLTDEMVRLAKRDDELVSVLAHEMGHVVHRHGLRGVIQSSIFAVIIVTITGDVSSSSSLIAALPTLLVESQYSQAFEREADSYSLQYMLDHNVDPAHFANLMQRMSGAKRENDVGRYFSSHPTTEERIERFRQARGGATGKTKSQ